jgi:hypothetical protein
MASVAQESLTRPTKIAGDEPAFQAVSAPLGGVALISHRARSRSFQISPPLSLLRTIAWLALVLAFLLPAPSALAATITSITPSSWVTGTVISFDIRGTGFTSNTTYMNLSDVAGHWNFDCGNTGGDALHMTYIDSTHVTCPSSTYARALTPGAGWIKINVGGTDSGAFGITILPPPTPTISSFNPTSITAGGTGFSLIVTGTNYVNPTTLYFNGLSHSTTFNSSTQVTAGIAGSEILTAAVVPVYVTNSNGTSTTSNYTINKANQTITFNALATKLVTDSPFSISATASSGLTVSFTSATTSICTVSTTTVTLTGTSGTCTINADQAGNGTYNAAPQVQQSFSVNNPVPTTSSISPTSTTASGIAFTLTVNGTGFISGVSTIKWNGSTTGLSSQVVVNSTQMTVTVAAPLIASPGTATVTVVNTTPGGGTSGGQTFNINHITMFIPWIGR